MKGGIDRNCGLLLFDIVNTVFRRPGFAEPALFHVEIQAVAGSNAHPPFGAGLTETLLVQSNANGHLRSPALRGGPH